MEDWARERQVVLETFAKLLAQATGDGSKKRQAGEKPPWWRDNSHLPALYRHIEQYEAGEKFSPDSGVHHLISVGWRALAAAYCELYGQINPENKE